MSSFFRVAKKLSAAALSQQFPRLLMLDNNSIERQMRPIAIGRKNYLFAGSHSGAQAAAILYSLINSCTLNKINPYEYLKDIITQCSVGPESLRDLLPDRWLPRSRAIR